MVADDGFAEQVERKREPVPSDSADRLQDFFDVGPGDKSSGHPSCIRAGIVRQSPAENAVAGRKIQTQSSGPRELVADVFEVLVQMPRDRNMVLQHRQDIDEAEHLNFDRFITHRPRHQPVFPPATVKDRRRPMLKPSKQLATDLLSPFFDAVVGRTALCCLLGHVSSGDGSGMWRRSDSAADSTGIRAFGKDRANDSRNVRVIESLTSDSPNANPGC